MACREDPQIALADVANEHLAVGAHHRYTRISVEYIGPFIGCVPVQFAIAPRCQAHVNARYIFRGWQHTLGHLVRPPPFLNPLLDEVEGVPQRYDIAMVCWGRVVAVGIQPQKSLVFLSWIARRMVLLGFL